MAWLHSNCKRRPIKVIFLQLSNFLTTQEMLNCHKKIRQDNAVSDGLLTFNWLTRKHTASILMCIQMQRAMKIRRSNAWHHRPISIPRPYAATPCQRNISCYEWHHMTCIFKNKEKASKEFAFASNNAFSMALMLSCYELNNVPPVWYIMTEN